MSHGLLDAAIAAENDVVFAYGRTGIRRSISAGHWIGDGSTSVPMDPTLIDDVFSHGAIQAQLLAGTSASSDPHKGRIGTIGSIGNAGGTYVASSIGRIRTAGLVTAGIHSGTAFNTGSGGGGSSGGPQILENQTNLINDVPEPQLDPSERDSILSDAAADKADVESDRIEIVAELSAVRFLLNRIRADILEEVADLRNRIRTEIDEIHPKVDLAVDAAQSAAKLVLDGIRLVIDLALKLEESGFERERREHIAARDRSLTQLAAAYTAAMDDMDALRSQIELQKGEIEKQEAWQHNEFVRIRLDRLEFWESRIYALTVQLAGSAAAAAKELYNWKENTDLTELLDAIETSLDVAGMAPGVGIIPDLLSTGLLAARGKWGEAGFNVLCAIPGAGDALKGAKMLGDAADAFKAAAKAAAKATENAAEILAAGKKAGNKLLRSITSVDDLAKLGVSAKRVLQGTNGKIAIIGRGNEFIADARKTLGDNGIMAETFDRLIPEKAFVDYRRLVRNGEQPEVLRNSDLYQLNLAWAQSLKDEGYTIIDLGNPGAKGDLSIFYEMEKEILGLFDEIEELQ